MKTITLSLAALVVGAMPTALAQSDKEAQPFSIEFSGSVLPSNPNAIAYPFLAASKRVDGKCDLALYVDKQDVIAKISVLSCSNPLFEDEARDFIEKQATPAKMDDVVLTKRLSVNWTMDPVGLSRP